MKTVVVIPARYGSSRFPGKPLADIFGKPMVQHVYEKASQAKCADRIIVATDDFRIVETVEKFGGEAVMTSPDHASGTDRIVEVAELVSSDIYINVQGDEPLIRPEDIDLVADAMMNDSSCKVATLCHPIELEDAINPNVVKVIRTHSGNALYFSRSLIPFGRDHDAHADYFKHIGLYGYTRSMLKTYKCLPDSRLEDLEKLEQLRILEADIPIKVILTDKTGPGVDTPVCLEKVKDILFGKLQKVSNNYPLKKIKLLISDVDGVLTTGHLEYTSEGEHCKKFHARDGLGVKMLQHCGVTVAVASGKESAALKKRLDDLGIDIFVIGESDKNAACKEIMKRTGLKPEETAYIGDDTLDLAGFSACSFSFAVADAPEYIKRASSCALKTKGGEGAFREAAEIILTAKGLNRVFETAEGFKEMQYESNQ